MRYIDAAVADMLLTQVTVLVVEDEEALLRYISRALEDAGYQVLRARNGNEALNQLRDSRLPVELVVTDVSMPGMTGPELAARCRHRRRNSYPDGLGGH